MGWTLARLFFKPFWLITGWRWHSKSRIESEHHWIDRDWDRIPEYVVRAGLLIYCIGVAGMVFVVVAWWFDR